MRASRDPRTGSLTRSRHEKCRSCPDGSRALHSPRSAGTSPRAVSRDRWISMVDASGNIWKPKMWSGRPYAVTTSAACPATQQAASATRARGGKSNTVATVSSEAGDLRLIAPACHDPGKVGSKGRAAVFLVVAGCAAPPKGPPLEVAVAPHVARSDGDGSTSTSTSTSTPALAFSTTVGHLGGPSRLTHLFEAFANLDGGHAHDDVRILQYGDSHTASDLGVGAFRRLLQSRFGDGGRGFVSIGRPWKTFTQDGIRGGMTREFEPAKTVFKNGHFSGDGCYGLLGIGIGASIGGARAWSEVAPRFSHVEFDYWQEPRGGSFDVFVDGAKAGRIATRAAESGAGFFGVELADAPHQVELRTVGDGEVRVFGMTLDRAQAGVVVDALGINGAQIFTLLRASEEHFAEQLRHQSPDLVVLAYGTNEALEPGLTDADYEHK